MNNNIGFGLSILSDTPHEIMNLYLENININFKMEIENYT